MNNTIETNQSYQKFKEILTARHIISRWLSSVQCCIACHCIALHLTALHVMSLHGMACHCIACHALHLAFTCNKPYTVFAQSLDHFEIDFFKSVNFITDNEILKANTVARS